MKKFKPVLYAVATILTTTAGYALPGNNASRVQLVASIIGIVLTLAKYIGIILIIAGVLTLVKALALKDNDIDIKSRGVHLVGIGIVLAGLKLLLAAAGLI